MKKKLGNKRDVHSEHEETNLCLRYLEDQLKEQLMSLEDNCEYLILKN